MDSFISQLTINKVRNISNLTIPLSSEHRKHLIFTGKNGSGKTTVLLKIRDALSTYESNLIFNNSYEQLIESIQQIEENKRKHPENSEHYDIELAHIAEQIKNLPTHIQFSNSKNIQNLIQNGKLILAFFDAKRHSLLSVPSGINKLQLQTSSLSDNYVGSSFLQFIVNMKADRAFAHDEGETLTVQKIDNWFKNLEDQLKYIFDVDQLKLKFDRHNYNFTIIIDDNITVDFMTLSDGYSAIISIISDLIMRMENSNAKAYDLEGIVIIDEIETHLHVDLQKKILPFLISFFPKIQFIITTHSPFVLTSLSNAVVCDLETKLITDDLSQYSYEAVLESYFNVDQYSEEVKRKIERFEQLLKGEKISTDETKELKALQMYFAHSPKFLSKELASKLLELELFEITQNNQ